MLFLAGCVNAFGVTVFLAPVHLYDSGVSGASILLSQITPEAMSLSVFLLLLNIPLFLFGAKKQGAAFTVYSLFAVSVYAAASWLITDVLPIDVSMAGRGPAAVRPVRRHHLGGGQRPHHPLRRSHRRRGRYGRDLRQEPQYHRGFLRDDL